MRRRDVILDLTRLATRFSRPTPNGIDRVDLGYAEHFFSEARGGRGVLLNPFGVRAVDNFASRSVVDAISEHWRESGRAEDDDAYRRLMARLFDEAAPGEGAHDSPSVSGQRPIGPLLRRIKIAGAQGLFPGRSLVRTAPENAIYLNVSQFPLWLDWYFSWLDRRPDIKAVFFIHDLLPIIYPEFFPPAEASRHRGRIRVLARRARGIIVASDSTHQALKEQFRVLSAPLPPVGVIPLPVATAFNQPEVAFRLEPRRPYFVSVGTIEPRKNQLLLLNIWREFAETLGDRTPRLLLVGARGWDNENVVDMLDRCRAIQPYVTEVKGLSTPALRRVMAGARAVLFPSLAEGYGLPVAEARATGVSLIVSNAIDHGPTDGAVVALDPLDGPRWRDAILSYAAGKRSVEAPALPQRDATLSWAWHMGNVESFVQSLH